MNRFLRHFKFQYRSQGLRPLAMIWRLFCLLAITSLLLLAQSSPAKSIAAKRKINLELDTIDGATAYEVKVTRKSKDGDKKPLFFKMKKAEWSAEINPGLYLLQLRSYDEREVPGDWSDPMEFWVRIPTPEILSPKHQQQFKTDKHDEINLNLQWKIVEGSVKYRIEVESDDSSFKKNYETENLSYDMQLAVGHSYKWKVIAIMPEGADGEVAEVANEFSLIGAPLEVPQIEPPLSKVVQEISWKAPPHATSYQYSLARQTPNNKWLNVEKKAGHKDNKLVFDLSRPSGRYRLQVKAEGSLYQDSGISSLEFDVQGELRSPAAIEQAVLKDSIEKPTNFYGIASYFITQMAYEGRAPDTGRSRFEAIGGTGRLGLGYHFPRSSWGTFGVIDLSGFNINNQNFTFSSAEVHGTYRLNLDSTGVVLLGAGLFYKELPEVYGNEAQGFIGVGKAKNIGPHAGIQYWLPINQKLGFQLNGRIYYSMLGKGPKGEASSPTMSTLFGALGSYRLRHNIMGYAGYAYRLDQASYLADTSNPLTLAEPGDIVSIQIQGHYLNLVLEYSF